MTWEPDGSHYRWRRGDVVTTVTTSPLGFSLVDAAERTLTASAPGDAYPSTAFAWRTNGHWQTLTAPSRTEIEGEHLALHWETPNAALVIGPDEGGNCSIDLQVAGAEAVAFALTSAPDEHYFGLGERFNKLDQREEIVDLWVKNGASGGDTYKPVPFLTSSRGYGIAINTTHRVYCALAHPTVSEAATFTVSADRLRASLFTGDTPLAILARYTALSGRPPAPPAWAFMPWKSRDWRFENQATALEDIRQQQALDLPCGVKLIDAEWETVGHSFRFDPVKYPDPAGMIREANAAGLQLVLWLSPNMTADTPEYEECAHRGFLIKDANGAPYRHRLGNTPGWEGTTIDFSNPDAVAWWQEQLCGLLEMGIRGFKTDFGEQVPADAVFANGKTGVEMHNLLPVLYNRATWEVVREYGGILLGRSAWTGSQPYPAIWAGDQSPDFSPWAGLPTAIVAGQSAGWSGFPYWGSDIGGYFNEPDDDVFVRWTQFAALTPIMEAHGLGKREPWLFSPSTLEIYRQYATLHAKLVPYSLSATFEVARTGLPLMRAMPLVYPDQPDAYRDWVQYQYLYGPNLLVAPVYSWGTSRQVWFPPGEWIDFFSGERYRGPSIARVPAPLDKLPLFVRAGSLLPLRSEPNIDEAESLDLLLYPGGSCRVGLRDATLLLVTEEGAGRGKIEMAGPSRRYRLLAPQTPEIRIALDGEDLRQFPADGLTWEGNRTVTYEVGE